ncbi:MFS transporter [Mesopusillimonas faecipullorum]|uniref:MFS transporter n=1 Tax=Mesopusillimonas faecipullorum TaxID=2755040 RepID=UPI001D00BD65|nr:MFS transporter [Mesopusillimonas faecipullorum]
MDTQIKRLIPVIGMLAFASMAATRICDPMLVNLAQAFGVDLAQAARVVSWYAVAYGVFQLLYGPLGDRAGKLRVVAGAGVVCASLSLLTALAPTYWTLVLARTLMGAAAAGIIPLSMAWIGDHVPYEHRQEALAKLLSTSVFGMMLGQWFGGFAAEILSWRMAFYVLCAAFLLGSLFLCLNARSFMTPPPATKAAGFTQYVKTLAELLRIPRVRWVLAVTLAEGALVYGAFSFTPSLLVDKFGMSVSAAGATMVLYGVGGLIYSPFARRWLALLGERGLALTGGSLITLALLLLGWTSTPWVGATACLMGGLGFYMLHNTLQTQATQMAPAWRGTAVTLFACILFLGQSLGVSLVAMNIGRFTLGAMFWVCAVGTMVLAWQVSRGVRTRASGP